MLQCLMIPEVQYCSTTFSFTLWKTEEEMRELANTVKMSLNKEVSGVWEESRELVDNKLALHFGRHMGL